MTYCLCVKGATDPACCIYQPEGTPVTYPVDAEPEE